MTLIVLGESFVKVLGALASEGAGIAVYGEASMVLLVTCSLWWVYFDDVAGSRIRSGRGQWIIWLYCHIPLQIGITAVGVAVKKAVHFGWDAPGSERLSLPAGGLPRRRLLQRGRHRLRHRAKASGAERPRAGERALGLRTSIAAAARPQAETMSGGAFLALVLVITVAQVAFDMMMAPFEEAAHTEIGAKTTAEIARERAERGEPVPVRAKRPDVSQMVRKGTPSELRRDLYFYFIEGSWTRVFVAFGFLFLITNVFFAAVYTLQPGSIAGARASSFSDAFFFSVQTLATIGYGALSPGNPFAQRDRDHRSRRGAHWRRVDDGSGVRQGQPRPLQRAVLQGPGADADGRQERADASGGQRARATKSSTPA